MTGLALNRQQTTHRIARYLTTANNTMYKL